MDICQLTPHIKRQLLKAMTKDELNSARKNITNNKFKLYKNENVYLLAEFDTIKHDLHIVALVGKYSIPTINGVFNYAREIGFNLYFQTRKKSVIRLFSYLKPIIINKDNDLYQVRIFTNG